MKFITAYGDVKTEMKRRDLWKHIVSATLPNKTVIFPTTLELFYVQDGPPALACWARYDTIPQLEEAYRQFTINRMRPGDTAQVSAVKPKVCR